VRVVVVVVLSLLPEVAGGGGTTTGAGGGGLCGCTMTWVGGGAWTSVHEKHPVEAMQLIKLSRRIVVR